jgi:hypothetical protein
VFESLGRSKKLHLTGRPNRPFGALNTAKIFRVFGDTVLCYPLLFEVRDFYVTADPAVLIEDIKVSVYYKGINYWVVFNLGELAGPADHPNYVPLNISPNLYVPFNHQSIPTSSLLCC